MSSTQQFLKTGMKVTRIDEKAKEIKTGKNEVYIHLRVATNDRSVNKKQGGTYLCTAYDDAARYLEEKVNKDDIIGISGYVKNCAYLHIPGNKPFAIPEAGQKIVVEINGKKREIGGTSRPYDWPKKPNWNPYWSIFQQDQLRVEHAWLERDITNITNITEDDWHLQIQEDWDKYYPLYLQTIKWKHIKQAVLKRDGHLCICGNKSTEIHHKRYDNVGKEPPSDLVSLCKQCHDNIHSNKK